MGIFDTWYCPNKKCVYKKGGSKGKHCPKCGSEMHPFGISEGGTLIREKKDPEFRESNKIKAEKEAEEKKRREEEESKLLEEYGNL
ncbi:MAG: hypothetical protein KUA33_08705, partial [Methanobacterium sp.]|nr:hypothetical protein [Methanobacterium sp.]